jgi:hypothetical protein
MAASVAGMLPRGPDPSGVRRPHDAGHRVGEQDRHAVGGQHRDPHPGQRGDHAIGVGYVGRERRGLDVDGGHPGAVHLGQVHHGHAEPAAHPLPVRGHRRRVVADPGGEVEAGEHAGRAAARAGAEHPPDEPHPGPAVVVGTTDPQGRISAA